MAEITSETGAVTTPSPRAAAAAVEVLKGGGNAVDAAVAAMLVTCVLNPDQVAIGGYGGAMTVYHAKSGRVYCIDFDARAPRDFRPAMYAKAAVALHGYLAVATPGVVAGLKLALERFGTRQWRGVSGHAVLLAEEGFAVDARLQNSLKFLMSHGDATSVRVVLPDGQLPKIGAKFVQKNLGKTLRMLDDDPGAFYYGEFAGRIVKQIRANGGLLSERDLAEYSARVTEPVHVSYRGFDLYSAPPPAGGITSLSILKTLEQFDLTGMQPWGAPYFELFCEIAKLAWQDRAKWLGDPDFVKVPVEEFLSEISAKAKAAKIRAGDWGEEKRIPSGGVHTAHLTAVDAERNMVSLTATQGETWGSCVVIEGLGIPLGHGMSRFTYGDPKSPNAPAAGKRMQHNMSPSVILRDGKPWATLGLPGGTRIVTVTAQLMASLIDFKATPGQAVAAPRVHTQEAEPLECSASVPKEVATELELMGHKVQRNGNTGGAASAIAVSDDRKLSAASGYAQGSVAGL
jgi:gamma-glutamyltranspeptidase/glutathione hydrolase